MGLFGVCFLLCGMLPKVVQVVVSLGIEVERSSRSPYGVGSKGVVAVVPCICTRCDYRASIASQRFSAYS